MIVTMTGIEQAINIVTDEVIQIDNCVGLHNKGTVPINYSFIPFSDIVTGATLLVRNTVMLPDGRTTVYISSQSKTVSLEVYGVGL